MQVTAKGYAELVDLLQADIAVLEGGYSVQEACHMYILVSFYLWQTLIIARSSNLPLTLLNKQSQNVTGYMDDLIAKWKVQWANRHKMAEEERTGVGRYMVEPLQRVL